VSDEGRPQLVAVIEDDAVARRALGRLLRAGGFDAALFGSAEAFMASQQAPLCLIVDVNLTGMSGLDLQKKLRSEGSNLPVIVTTGQRSDVIRERAQRAGCAAFLWKPFSADTILALVGSIAADPRTGRSERAGRPPDPTDTVPTSS
jgi:FixJ family two-component response regulator